MHRLQLLDSALLHTIEITTVASAAAAVVATAF